MTGPAPPTRVRIAAVGDVMMARDVGRHYDETPDHFSMTAIREVMADADLLLANLENPVAIGGRPDPVQDPHITFRAAPETLHVLKDLGVSVVSLGNNHMLDFGEEALIETIEHLDAAGIKWVGAGRNYEEANRPLFIECNGHRLAFLGYAFIYSANSRMASARRPGISDHRLSRILPRIRDLRAAGFEIVVTVHWGYEYCFFPLPYQMRQARRMIDAGACLVIGHGPHYPQGIETYRGRDIVYSLGNFIFDEPHKFANRAYIYATDIDQTGVTVGRHITPVHLDRHVPRLADGAETRRMKDLLACLARRYEQTDHAFWREHSAAYLTDICGRVVRSRSLKFLRVPPISFYRDVGAGAILRKLKPSTLLGVSRSLRPRT